MNLKIEEYADWDRTTIRLIGRMQAEYLDELKQIRESGPAVILDLEEVTLVDVENEAAQSIKLVHFQSTFLR